MTKKIFENPDDRLRAMNVIKKHIGIHQNWLKEDSAILIEFKINSMTDVNRKYHRDSIATLKTILGRFERNIIWKEEMLEGEG